MNRLGGRPIILAVTDRLGNALTNGSQVMAQAVLLELSQWFELKIFVQQAGALPEMDAEVVVFNAAEEGLAEKIEQLLHRRPLAIYNFGCAEFSAEATAIIHSLALHIPIINHFQLVLPEYARHEGYAEDDASGLGINCRHVAEHALYNIFPSFSELNRVMGLGWEIQSASNCVIRNVHVPAEEMEVPAAPAASIIFMAAGRFSDYVKGADLLYRAFSQYHKLDPDAHLLVASDEKRFISLLADVPATAWTYLGWLSREALHARLRQADVVIVPSRYEPFGLVAIEAMAVGKPVIAMAVDGLAEIVHHNHTGWLTDPHEGSLGIRLAMQAAAQQKQQLPAMGQRCKAVVEQEFLLARAVRQVRKIFDNISHPVRVGKITATLSEYQHHDR